MIKWTYISSLWKEYEFEIEKGELTHSNLWDEEDDFYEEITSWMTETWMRDIEILIN